MKIQSLTRICAVFTNYKFKKRFTFLGLLAFFCCTAPILQAKDEICDGQAGAAYGLCTSYYDAVHCQQEPANAKSMACQKIAKTFMEITGVDIMSICPCFLGVPDNDPYTRSGVTESGPCDPQDENDNHGGILAYYNFQTVGTVTLESSFFCNDPSTYSCTTINGTGVDLTETQFNSCLNGPGWEPSE